MLRIVLEKPLGGVEYGIQKGKGINYETIQKQVPSSGDLTFEINVDVKFDEKNNPVFIGPFAQGPRQERFIYVDIGTSAGQKNTHWSRRLKIPLSGITKNLIERASTNRILITKFREPPLIQSLWSIARFMMKRMKYCTLQAGEIPFNHGNSKM